MLCVRPPLRTLVPNAAVSFSLPACNQSGTKLPNLTDEDVNWQGLEDLYSINESLYECRPDYSPSPDNWLNFQKDVDNMFALRHVLNKYNQTRKLDDSTLPELGSGAGGGGLEVGSGEESHSVGSFWPGPTREHHLTTPAPSTMRSVTPTSRTTPGKLESVVNDLPERFGGRSGESVLSPSPAGDKRVQQLEEVDGEVFSGNGITELGTRHDSVLRTHNSLQAQLELDPAPAEDALRRHSLGLSLGLDLDLRLGLEKEEDIFQIQGFLPLSLQTLRPKVQASPTGSPPTTQDVGMVLQVLPQAALPLTLAYEGSGSLPPPSNQTL